MLNSLAAWWHRPIERILNRRLPENRRISVRVGWPLFVLPVIVLNQLLAPHIVWMVLSIVLAGLYAMAYLWVRTQAPSIEIRRRRVGTILVAGDVLVEELVLSNAGQLPLLWAEYLDGSTVPDYAAGRVVSAGGSSRFEWRTQTECRQRGVFQLGPHELLWHDPLGLFAVTVSDDYRDVVLIYPRVVQLPPVRLPRGDAQGVDRGRRPFPGTVPAATVSDYRSGDSLRFVHWASTARRDKLMVKDLEIEPSGDIWIVLDLNRAAQRGDGVNGTLEQSVIVAASLAAKWLPGHEQRSVGLLAYSGAGDEGQPVQVAPGMGRGHLWQVLAALAPVRAGDLTLARLLDTSMREVGRRGTVVVITPDIGANHSSTEHEGWLGALARLNVAGMRSSVVLVTQAGAEDALPAAASYAEMLTQLDVPVVRVIGANDFPPVLTYRRRRTILRSTPTGGVVRQEIDEEVG